MTKIASIPTFASAAEAKKYLSSPEIKLKRYASSNPPSMGQAFARMQAEVINSGKSPSSRPVRTARAARRFVEKIVQGDCCIINEDGDGLSVELNCRSLQLADLLSCDGLVRIGQNTFKVDKNSVTLIDGAMNTRSTTELFREFGYQWITDATASNKKSASMPEIVWQLTRTVTQLNKRLPAYGYRVTLIVTQYRDSNKNFSYCVIDVTPQMRNWVFGFPLFLPTLVDLITIGGAFSGPKSPTFYDLPNPFNHVGEAGKNGLTRSHWRDKDPGYQVDSCAYDCSVYPYGGGRVDANVWK